MHPSNGASTWQGVSTFTDCRGWEQKDANGDTDSIQKIMRLLIVTHPQTPFKFRFYQSQFRYLYLLAMGRTWQSISKYFYDFLLEGRYWWLRGPIVGYLALLLLVGLVWVYFHRHYVHHKLFPFRTLENKIAVDDIMIMDWTDHACDGELYLVDTVSGAIRQLTYDDFMDGRPVISKSENRVYFLSNKPIDGSRYPRGRHRLFYFDMPSLEIYSTEREFQHILKSEASKIEDYVISEDLMALVEDYDSTRLYLIDLKDKAIVGQWTVTNPVRLVNVEWGRVTTRYDGKTREYLVPRPTRCDTIYSTVDQNPEYHEGMNGLMQYFTQRLLSVITECTDGDKEFSAQMAISFTIDAHGNVIDAELSDHHLPEDCVLLLRNRLVGMTGWSPGYRDGRPVCARYGWKIRGVKWN